MEMINHVIEVWDQLEKGATLGLLKRLFSTDSSFKIYCTYQYPERFYGIAFSFRKEIKININSFKNLSEFKVLLYNDPSFENSNILVIQLLNGKNKKVFADLCESLIMSVNDSDSERSMITTVVNQLERWKVLFGVFRSTGLSIEEQQGLFGELCFLEKIFKKDGVRNIDALHSWVGVDKALRDFQGINWALEVKTTSTNNPQKVKINGERQLDETRVEQLYLYHLSVEVSNRMGISLVDKIHDIRDLLSDDLPCLSLFNSKLFEAGYLDSQESLYEDRTYQMRTETVYKVDQEFPRIRENELRGGVCDVKYSIVLVMCEDYIVTISEFFNNLKL
mgnify:CR=1 FL=1